MTALQTVLAALGLTAALSQAPHAQGEAGLPFLLNPPSSEANGMGGTSIALQRFDPTASIFSPAQTGLSALRTNVRGSFYPTTAGLVTLYGFPDLDLEYSASAVSAGVRLNDFIELPLRIGFGLAYHHVAVDYGTFIVTGEEGPEEKGRFEAHEDASGFVLGVGIEYLLRFGFGYTFRSVASHLSAVGPPEISSADAQEEASDYSFLLEAPLLTVVEEVSGWDAWPGGSLYPFLDLSAGMGWNNMGDRLVYVDQGQADPFPRSARAGIALKGGVRLDLPVSWEVLSAAWSREAEDLLVLRDSAGWEYQTGLGDIEFGQNVLQGKLTDNVGLRSGWQIQAAEIFTYRQGSVRGSATYSTRGYTVQLAGMMKGLAQVMGNESPDWLLFARDHVDVQYHIAEYTLETTVTNTVSYSSLVFAFRVLPW